MLTKEDIAKLEELAYVPEHLPNLMVSISKGEPYLIDGYFLLVGDSWVIVNGYRLEGKPSEEKFLEIFETVKKRYDPSVIWAISSSFPQRLIEEADLHEKDFYFTLDLSEFSIPKNLRKAIEETRRSVRVVFENSYSPFHKRLVEEFVERKRPNEFVSNLYLSLPRLLSCSSSTSLISAYGEDGRLVGFYAVDVASKKFLTYVLGCRDFSVNKLRISDLIFVEMVEYARAKGKEYIHLGLGVNEGIRRFKEKWGGKPKIPYEFIEIRRKESFLRSISFLEAKL